MDETNMLKNFKMSKDIIVAEPLYILLASLGHPDAHEYVRKTIQEREFGSGHSLHEILGEDEINLRPYLKKLSPLQKEVIKDPSRYIGISSEKTKKVCRFWQGRLKDLL